VKYEIWFSVITSCSLSATVLVTQDSVLVVHRHSVCFVNDSYSARCLYAASDAGEADVGSSASVHRCVLLRPCDAQCTVGETLFCLLMSCVDVLLSPLSTHLYVSYL